MDIEDSNIPDTAVAGFIVSAERSEGAENFDLLHSPRLTVASYVTWGAFVLEAPTLVERLTRIQQVIDLHASYWSWHVSLEGDIVWLR